VEKRTLETQREGDMWPRRKGGLCLFLLNGGRASVGRQGAAGKEIRRVRLEKKTSTRVQHMTSKEMAPMIPVRLEREGEGS